MKFDNFAVFKNTLEFIEEKFGFVCLMCTLKKTLRKKTVENLFILIKVMNITGFYELNEKLTFDITVKSCNLLFSSFKK